MTIFFNAHNEPVRQLAIFCPHAALRTTVSLCPFSSLRALRSSACPRCPALWRPLLGSYIYTQAPGPLSRICPPTFSISVCVHTFNHIVVEKERLQKELEMEFLLRRDLKIGLKVNVNESEVKLDPLFNHELLTPESQFLSLYPNRPGQGETQEELFLLLTLRGVITLYSADCGEVTGEQVCFLAWSSIWLPFPAPPLSFPLSVTH